MQEVEILCDRVIIINNGKIVADRPTAELKNLNQEKIYQLEFDRETTASQLKKIEGVSSAESLDPSHKRWLLRAKADSDIRSAVFKFAVSREMVVLEIKQEEQKLEQIFQQLTNK